jgi:hypothetical protein
VARFPADIVEASCARPTTRSRVSRLPFLGHIYARFVTQGHLVSEVPMCLVMNVGRGRPRMTLPATPFATHDGAGRVGYARPPMTAANEARRVGTAPRP